MEYHLKIKIKEYGNLFQLAKVLPEGSVNETIDSIKRSKTCVILKL